MSQVDEGRSHITYYIIYVCTLVFALLFNLGEMFAEFTFMQSQAEKWVALGRITSWPRNDKKIKKRNEKM